MKMASKKIFVPEAEPAIVYIDNRKTIIDNHVAKRSDYELCDYIQRWKDTINRRNRKDS